MASSEITDFLSFYGWIIVVLLVGILFLYSEGLILPGRQIDEKCTVFTHFEELTHTLTQDGTFRITFRNSREVDEDGAALTIRQMELRMGDMNSEWQGVVYIPFQEYSEVIAGGEELRSDPGEMFIIELTVRYNLGRNKDFTDTATCVGRVV